MKVPLSWLREFVSLDADPDEVADKLTAAGMKVEKVVRPVADLEGVVVAEVLKVEPHPDADRLVLVDVRTDASERRVVCGAKNFGPGDRVPLAVPGSRLPEYPSFEAKKIRGVLSDGMLCSARDMGLDDDHSGIYILDPASPLGADVKEVLGLDDVVFELEITPNRPDAMSIIGIAREVAACFGGEVAIPPVDLETGSRQVSALVSVQVDDVEGCPRYMARVVTGVKVAPSPPLVQRRLAAAGVRPISNVVDATNYALLITGQPMHAFDLGKLAGNAIIVRGARPGEKIVTIDQVERELDLDDLVIADADAPVAIAGVMGGAHSEVGDDTVDVMLESAYFAPKKIFRASRRHALRSEASARFERGVDPDGVAFAADLAVRFILDWAGGELAEGAIDVYPKPVGSWEVTLRPERARAVLGTEVTQEEMLEALKRLGLEPSTVDGGIVAKVPSRRHDIKIEEDLIEEVARVVGYERVGATLPSGSNRNGGISPEERFVRRVRGILAGAGLHEARTDSLVGPDLLAKMGDDPNDTESRTVSLTNPLTRDRSLLRGSLLPGLVEAAVRNLERGRSEVRLFEIGTCFRRGKGPLPDEPLCLGIVMAGVRPEQWYDAQRRLDLFDVKGVMETLLEALHVSHRVVAYDRPPFHPTRSARLVIGQGPAGVMGELGPKTLARLDVDVPIVVAELSLRTLTNLPSEVVLGQQESRFPAVLLDLAVVVDEAVPAGKVAELAAVAGGDLLESVRIFDVYRGEQVGAGKKSVALALVFRSMERTLTEAEVVSLRNGIVAALASDLGATIRA